VSIPALAWPQLLLIATCRMAAFGGFSSLYVLSAETFPTSLRTTAFGLVSSASRLAGTLTPFVAGTVWAASPAASLLTYAATALGCALVIRHFVPDTMGRPLPELPELATLTRGDTTLEHDHGGGQLEARDHGR
jgi:hypothetical protein